eukprot:jgi/Botrbrau1/19211/Bobra.0077s0112.1
MALVAIAIAFLLAVASTANCRELLSEFAGASTTPRNVAPADPPAGSVRKNIQGEVVRGEGTNGPTECAKFCANYEIEDPQTRRGTGRYPNYYSYCNSLSGCSPYYLIGRCHCLDISGTPQYAADTTSTPGDGWISGPVAASGAGQPAFSDPTFKNLQGRTLQSFYFGNMGTVADCQAKCAASSDCKGFNFCPAGGPGTCPSGVVGQCDIKTWDSGPATFYAEATDVGGDGWQSSYRVNLSS